jgi:hypothetical protein
MRTSLSSLSLHKDYCHPISTENYFLSPKMPVKDHVLAFRTTKTSFRPLQPLEQTSALERVDLNCSKQGEELQVSLGALRGLNLLRPKNLHVINHRGADKSLNSNIHTMQTNPGYSRNALGGIYTK